MPEPCALSVHNDLLEKDRAGWPPSVLSHAPCAPGSGWWPHAGSVASQAGGRECCGNLGCRAAFPLSLCMLGLAPHYAKGSGTSFLIGHPSHPSLPCACIRLGGLMNKEPLKDSVPSSKALRKHGLYEKWLIRKGWCFIGMKDGQKILFHGEGDQEPELEPGDVIIVLDQKDHSVFQRRGHDLIMKMKIQLSEALCGFKKTIKTLDNRILVITSKSGNVSNVCFHWRSVCLA